MRPLYIDTRKPWVEGPDVMPGTGHLASATAPAVFRNNFDGNVIGHIILL
jgi:hypothetical protein